MRKLMSILLVAVMLFGIVGTAAFAHTSSDVITASDAGGGDLTTQEIWIIIGIVVLVAALIIFL